MRARRDGVRQFPDAIKGDLSSSVRACPIAPRKSVHVCGMNHIALAHRNAAPGWVIMGTEGPEWLAERVEERLPLEDMLREALALLAQHPEADFTFSTRKARDIEAAPFDRLADLSDITSRLERAAITVMVPMGDSRWRILQRAQGIFQHANTFSASDVHTFLRSPADASAIERGLSGPIEVWLRRQWSAEAVLNTALTGFYHGNVVPLPTRDRERTAARVR